MNMGSDRGGSGFVEVISSKGCSKLMVGFSNSIPSFRSLQSSESNMSSAPSLGGFRPIVQSNGPFSGLVICVTGLSKGKPPPVFDLFFFLTCIFHLTIWMDSCKVGSHFLIRVGEDDYICTA